MVIYQYANTYANFTIWFVEIRRDMETKTGDVKVKSRDIKTYVELRRFMYLNPYNEKFG